MAIPSPDNVPLDPASVPSWAAAVQAAINAALAVNWKIGQQARSVILTASQFGLQQLPAQTGPLLDGALGEYRAAGWQIGLRVLSPTQVQIVFERW